MAIFVRTANPQQLLDKIRDFIDKGEIKTWQFDSDNDLTYYVAQFVGKAWFHPIVAAEENSLIFGIIANQKIEMSSQLYAIYHARFLEILLLHFTEDFTVVWPSRGKTKYDLF